MTRAQVDSDVLGIAAPFGTTRSTSTAFNVAAPANRADHMAEVEILGRVCGAAQQMGERLAVATG